MNQSSGQSELPDYVLPKHLATMQDADNCPLILNVITDEAHREAHIPGSFNCCVYEVAFEEQVALICQDKGLEHPIVVYGWSDATREAEEAAARLRAAGHPDVAVLKGGLEAWKASGRAVVRASDGNKIRADAKTVESVDTAQSVVIWTGRNRFNHHSGTVGFEGGLLHFENGSLVGAEVRIDMETIACSDIPDATLNKLLVDHLKGEDFFDVASFPTANFRAVCWETIKDASDGQPNLKLTGELTMRGQTHTVETLAYVYPHAEGGYAFQAIMEIDRTLWGVHYGSGRFFAKLGKHLVNDHILLHLKIITQIQDQTKTTL